MFSNMFSKSPIFIYVLSFIWIQISNVSPQDDNYTTNDIFTINSTPTPANVFVCPNEWFFYEDTNTCFYNTFNDQNWKDSKEFCINLCGSLASFHSVEETEFVEGLLTESAWIGLNDIQNEGDFHWADGTTFDFNNWDNGEPSTPLFPILSNEDCVEMRKFSSYKWNNEDCSDHKYAVCSRKPETGNRTECPESWISDENENCYKMSTIRSDYIDAVKICSLSAVGSSLAAPTSQSENDFLASILTQNDINKIWIGVNDIEKEKDFQNVEGFPQTFFNWDQNEPNQFLLDEDCVEMYQTGKWNDDKCYENYHFVCKAPFN